MNLQSIRVVSLPDMGAAKEYLAQVGADGAGVQTMAPKGVFRAILVEGVSTKAANILKQEMLSKGGEAAVHRGVVNFSVETTSVLLMGTVKQLRMVAGKLKAQPFGLARLSEALLRVLDNLEPRPSRVLDCRGKLLTLGERTLVMGILNVTPDSFSDGGQFNDLGKALDHAWEMIEAGADIIDLGGESTRPGTTPVDQEEELRRVIPVVKELAKQLPVPISVDTYKAEVARQSLEEGAHIINDVWGLQADAAMAGVVAQYGAPVVVMHNRNNTVYRNLMGEILEFLAESIALAEKAGIDPDKIIVDPGIGFGKEPEQSLEVMAHLEELAVLGKAVLLGTSRKRFIGHVLDLPVEDRVEGTAATISVGIAKGADIIRVHDVKEMVRVAKMTDAMVRR